MSKLLSAFCKFIKFLQYPEFLAYVLMKAGSLYYLLKNIQAEWTRKKMFTTKVLLSGF